VITVGTHMIEQGVEMLCHELDRILARVYRNDPVLALYTNQAYSGAETRWTVLDLANGCVRMITPTSRETAVRFAQAFVERHPGSSFDGAEEFSVRVPSNVVPIREGVA
jgi:hypothetical protein